MPWLRVFGAAALLVAAGVSAYLVAGNDSSVVGPRDGNDAEVMTLEPAKLFEPPVTRAQRDRRRFVPGRAIVSFRTGVSESEKRRIRTEVGVRLLRRLPLPGAELVSFVGNRSVDDVRNAFEEHPQTAYSEPDVIYDISTQTLPKDPAFNSLWGLNNFSNTDIDAPEAWSLTTGSPRVTVGIVDTGVASDHPDLASNIWSNPGESGGGRESNGVDDDQNGFVDDVHGWDWVEHDNVPDDQRGHGTHVAGTVGAVGNNGVGVTGANWTVGIVPLRVLDAEGSGTSSRIAAAFSYAGKMGLDVVNASLGGPSPSQTVLDAIKRSPATLFVTAAGNDALDNDLSGTFPCNHAVDNLICVAAVSQSDNLATFSNYGASTVHLGAPGQSITSTVPAGYGTYSGTSMASPHVAGVAALLRSVRSDAPPRDLRDAILGGAVKIPALEGMTITGARLNVAGALRALGVAGPTAGATSRDIPSPTPSPSMGKLEQAAPTESPLSGQPDDIEPTITPTPTPTPTPTSTAAPASDPQVSPPPSADAPVPAVAQREVSLRLVRHLVGKVVVTSPSNPQDCQQGTRVTIKRNGNVIVRGKTNSLGRFDIRLEDRRGKYTAVVPATNACGRGFASATHNHRDRSAAAGSPTTEIGGFSATCWEPLFTERQLRRLHNLARLSQSVERLRLDGEMSRLARDHSNEMLERGLLFHRPDLGSGVSGWSVIGENVALASTVMAAEKAFMTSEVHRRNVLDARFTHLGVGVAQDGDRSWVTVIFKAASNPQNEHKLPIC